MIAFLPSLYPNELFYSMIARYHVRTGRADAGTDIDLFYDNRRDVPPDFEFIGKLRAGVLPFLLEHMSFTDNDEAFNYFQTEDRLKYIVSNHTLFLHYARFTPAERRKEAFDAMCVMKTKLLYQRLSIPQRHKERYARYCPLCAAEARERYGEAYWSTLHNLFGVSVCPLHECRLVITDKLRILPRKGTALLSAEEVIPYNEEAIPCNNMNEIRLAQYVADVFRSPLILDNDISIGEYLQSRLGSQYISPRGTIRRMERLQNDFQKMYEGIDLDGFCEIMQLTKIFEGKRIITNEICALAMLIGVTAEELSVPVLPEIGRTESVDRTIRELREKGWTYKQISEELDVPYYTCKDVGGGKHSKRR